MTDAVRRHYELYPYPDYPLLASIRRCDSYALSLEALWARFNGSLPPERKGRILIAGCGSFAPYPFSVANPKAKITALDLSRPSLARARLHCLLHGRPNVTFRTGDLLDPDAASGPFELIDAYGVLHHLNDPLEGLRALAGRLVAGGILRLMVYSRYARADEESIRRAFRLLKVQDPATARSLIARSKPGSRLARFSQASPEAGFDSGLADALLHPCVHTYRIDELMEQVGQSGLEALLFAHQGALDQVASELERLRNMEADRRSPGNFVLYLGKSVNGPCSASDDSLLLLNPCLAGSLGRLSLGRTRIAGRLGHANPELGWKERSFLRRFVKPVPLNSLSTDARAAAEVYIKALFLLQYRG
jgi:SAM-dependent methyltransferase